MKKGVNISDSIGNKRISLRKRQALETRRTIVASAQQLFTERGYVATTIEAIAEVAGVAVSTVYYAFGSKVEILRGIRELWHERSMVRRVLEDSDLSDTVVTRLEKLAHATRLQWETGSDVTSIYRQAAAADPAAATELESALAGRRKAITRFVDGLSLVEGHAATPGDAAAIVRALCRHEVFEELVVVSGWSPDKYEEWLAGTLREGLIR